jgi:outer membrane protein assembly factor BamB
VIRRSAPPGGRLWIGSVLVWVACAAPQQQLSPCAKDVDCKGTRVCELGVCIAPRPSTGAVTIYPGDAGPPDPSVDAAPPPPPPGPPPLAQGRGDPRHTGRVGVPAPKAAPQKTRWAVMTKEAIAAGVTLAPDGTAYVAGHDGILRAIAPDGTVRWTFAAEDRSWTQPAVTGDGAVLFGSDDDHLYAVEAATGTLRWKFRAGACEPRMGFGPVGVRCDVDGGPTVGPDGTIYFGADGVYALAPDGTKRWHLATVDHVGTAPAVGPDGMVYAGGLDDVVRAIKPDGQLAWEVRLRDDIESSPAVGEDGTIYIGADDGKLHAFAPSGQEKWALVTLGPVRAAPAIAADGTVIVGSYDKFVYAVRPDGQVAWRFATAGRVHAPAVIAADGTVLIGSQDDQIYALGPDGTLRWFMSFAADVDAPVGIMPDGTLIVAGDDKHVRAFSP